MGPFREGHDQEVNNPRYALIAVYTVPIDGEGCPLPAGLAELRKNGGHPHALDEREEDVDETEELRGIIQVKRMKTHFKFKMSKKKRSKV